LFFRIHAEKRPKLISSFTKRRNDFQFQRRIRQGGFLQSRPLGTPPKTKS